MLYKPPHLLLWLPFLVSTLHSPGQTGQKTARLPCHLSNDEGIFNKMDIYPEFPGSEKAWYDYVQSRLSHFKIKDSATDSSYTDSVLVHFTVTRDGHMCALTVTGGRTLALRLAIERLLLESAKWIPGTSEGRYLNAYKTLLLNVVVDPAKQTCNVIRKLNDYYYEGRNS